MPFVLYNEIDKLYLMHYTFRGQVKLKFTAEKKNAMKFYSLQMVNQIKDLFDDLWMYDVKRQYYF